MRHDPCATQWERVLGGELDGPDGASYVRRSTRTKRRECDERVQEGCPVVRYSWAQGRLEWYDGPDAAAVWREVRASVTSEPPPGGEGWTAGVWWSADERVLLVLTGFC